MKKLTSIILHSSFFLLHFSLLAAVPLKWTVETSRLQPVHFDAYHGEELALEATLNSYGKPLAIPSNADLKLFWQTNGMGNVYWATNATLAASNVVAATFLPDYDPGAAAISGFLGVPGSNYRAAFVLRFRNSPGATPFQPPPLPSYVYYTKDETDASLAAVNAALAASAVSATNYTDALAVSLADASAAATNHTDTATNATLAAARAYTDASVAAAGSVTPEMATNAAAAVVVRDVPEWARSTTPPVTTETDPTVPSWAKAANPPESMTDNAAVLTNGVLETKSGTAITAANVGAATASDVSTAIATATNAVKSAADAAYYPKSQGEAWSSYWDGDDVRVTVTNYDSAVNLPSFYLEQRTNETALATNLFKTVWTEMGHWDKFLGTNWNWSSAWSGFSSWKSSVETELDEKADKAWGYYNSHTGTYSPDGYTQISSSNVMIAAGMSYQKTATATADVWILTANEPYEPTGISTNGGFQLKDADGNVQFEIIRGDKATVAAQANAVGVTNSTLYVVYNIVAAQHPTAEVCLDLTTAAWKTETAADCPATVAWTGSSGRYVAAITPTATTTKCFVKATYERGGDTYINNRCAVGMSKLVLNGTTYTLGTATISGNTVLTLTPEN